MKNRRKKVKITFEKGHGKTFRKASIYKADFIGVEDIIHAFAKLLTMIGFQRKDIYDGLFDAADLFASDVHEIDKKLKEEIT
jgi:hypothetical protein